MRINYPKIIFKITLILVFLISILGGIALVLNESAKPSPKSKLIKPFLTQKVREHEPLVKKHAEEFGVADHTDVILAIMMQESGGRGEDPMQSSESLCGEVGCINDVEKSIEQGVEYFSKALDASGGDIKLAVQSYNFGLGFINYVNENKEVYSEEIAIEFSKKMYDNAKDQSIYTCLREESKQYNACYGDILYARDVMEYKELFAVE